MGKQLQIHNSTAEFLIFQLESKEKGIEALYQEETLWLTQDAIAALFDKGVQQLQSIYKTSFKAKSYKKIQFVGNSDELPLMVKITLPNIIILMLLFQ